jgi:hypothetical protein
MTAFSFGSAKPATSEFDARATLLGLQISRVLWRRRLTTRAEALDNALDLISRSQLVSGAAIWSDEDGESSDDRGFGTVEDPSKYTIGSYKSSGVWVGVGLIPHETVGGESLSLLAELLSQQVGRFLVVCRLRRENGATRQQLSVDREALQLRRLMERAQTLLVRQGPMTRAQAGDYLVATSIRTGEPLLDVARSVVLAYGGLTQLVGARRQREQLQRRAVA